GRGGEFPKNKKSQLKRGEKEIENKKNEQDREGHNDEKALFGTLLTFVFTLPIDVVAARQLDLRGHFPDGFFDGPAEIASAHAVFDRDEALIGLAINFGGAVARLNSAELREGD